MKMNKKINLMNKADYARLFVSAAKWCIEMKFKGWQSYLESCVTYASDANSYRVDDRYKSNADDFVKEMFAKGEVLAEIGCPCGLKKWLGYSNIEFKPQNYYSIA